MQWLGEDEEEGSDGLPEPGVLAAEIVEHLEVALENVRRVSAELESGAE